jgi:predicted metal-dependent peptidase
MALIKNGDYTLIQDPSERKGEPGGSQQQGGQKQEGIGKAKFTKDVQKMDQTPEMGETNPQAVKTFRDFTQQKTDKLETGKVVDATHSSQKSKIEKGNRKKKDWGMIASNALASAGSKLSDKAKSLFRKLSASTEPLVNWKKELKKFFDHTFKGEEWTLPNKRYIAGGDAFYGRKNIGQDTLKTIACAVDTSGSISDAQIKVFINEVMYLCKTFDADRTIIIYCSDHIDDVDDIKKGGKPDFTKIKSTGGNQDGFIPPFEWLEQRKIIPSVFIYLTDTGGDMPNPKKYGIPKYVKRIFWMVVSPHMYNKPSFGKILFAPVGAIKVPFDKEKIDRYGK